MSLVRLDSEQLAHSVYALGEAQKHVGGSCNGHLSVHLAVAAGVLALGVVGSS